MVISTRVKVKQGTVIGGEDVLPNGTSYIFFKGIPYAVPPLGELRFKAPKPLEKFDKPEIVCKIEGPMSIQEDRISDGVITGSEDCLFMNIYVPKINTTDPLPVMLYIHGGGHVNGHANSDKHNPLYLLQEGVLVVTFNYRVGVLGFLSLPDGNVPGNACLKDQRLVMEWVQENISQFNGDPNNVTLFGHSSGGICTYLHLLSKGSRKFFHKVIIQSGIPGFSSLTDENASTKTKNLARSLGCSSDDPLEIIKFLQGVENLEPFVTPLVGLSGMDSFFSERPIPVKPVVERESPEAVISKNPFELINEEDSIKMPVMTGYTSGEGIGYTSHFSDSDSLSYFNNDLRLFVQKQLNLPLEDPRCWEISKSVKELYFKGEQLDKKTLRKFADLLGDLSFIIHAHEAVEIISKKQPEAPLYFYRFDFDGQLNLYKKKVKMEYLPGASHVDELCYLYQMNFAPPEPWEPYSKMIVLTLCKLWANFAKYSNPTPKCKGEEFDFVWEPVSKVGNEDEFIPKALIFDKEIKMMENPDGERVNFWKQLKKKYYQN